MSDELATDEAEADEFEVDTLRDERLEAEENADGKHGPPAGYGGVGRDEVVFDIGDEADSEEEGDMGRQADNKGKKGRKSDEEEAIGEVASETGEVFHRHTVVDETVVSVCSRFATIRTFRVRQVEDFQSSQIRGEVTVHNGYTAGYR